MHVIARFSSLENFLFICNIALILPCLNYSRLLAIKVCLYSLYILPAKCNVTFIIELLTDSILIKGVNWGIYCWDCKYGISNYKFARVYT